MKVSIIIPVYNVEEYIEQCLQSIINQTYKNIEIIIVNDGSPDKSGLIIEKYSKKDSRIKVINKENGGLSSARNSGILKASGEYVLHVDGDDYIDRKAVEMLLKKAEETQADIVIGDVLLVFENSKNEVWVDSTLREIEVVNGIDYLEQQYFVGKARNCIWNKLIRRNLYTDYNISHPENISLGEDSGTLPALLLHARKVAKINHIVSFYRQNPNSMMNQNNKKILQYKSAISQVKQHFKDYYYEELFNQYEEAFKYHVYYTEVMHIPYSKAKKYGYSDYIEGWNELLNEISLLCSNKYIVENLSRKQSIKLNLYRIHYMLGDFSQFINDFIKRITH